MFLNICTILNGYLNQIGETRKPSIESLGIPCLNSNLMGLGRLGRDAEAREQNGSMIGYNAFHENESKI